MTPPEHVCDALVIGSGAAGFGFALDLPETFRTVVLSKGRLDQGATNRAQGGIAAVLGPDDSFDAHVRDTLDAGAGLCVEPVVRFAVERGPEAIRWLESLGVRFTRDRESRDGRPHLTREGGHSRRRVVHADDATGRAVQSCLEAEASRRPNIHLLENRAAIDLIVRDDGKGVPRCAGAYVLDLATGRVETFRARLVMLATGGASGVYLHCTNPANPVGDGIAMAWRAGCRVADMEFTQFHPTSFYRPGAETLLISEAVRGEGGVLRLPGGACRQDKQPGETFMARFDPRGDLAPRDIVARAIDHEMKRLGIPCVHLDISHRPPDFVREHFPTLHALCLERGVDMTAAPIPVVPAAHYTCGGIVVDLDARTDLAGLYAAGECACTGLHGANRLASNSLLECVVFARAAATHAAGAAPEMPDSLPPWDESRVRRPEEEVTLAHDWDEIRRLMWNYVGIVRTVERLRKAQARIALLKAEVENFYVRFRVTPRLVELRDMATVADLIIRSALERKESRGLHCVLDYPKTDDARPPRDTVLSPKPRSRP
ncbi:MAG: L-aspartate oxidase [Alphaproteobacteria bacterium]|nr:L-aspartate oxidase [Alphaproteobacteria bacterium]